MTITNNNHMIIKNHYGKKIKVGKDQENATLMLYCNMCNIWCKNVIQISYKDHKFSVYFY